MNRLRQVQQRGEGDAGFTLVELAVTMLITGIVLAMVGTFFANLARITSWASRGRVAPGQAALALDELRAVVRVAVDNPTSTYSSDPAAVAWASPTSFALYTYSNTSASTTTPTLVSFALDSSGYLTESRQAGSIVSGTTYYAFAATGTTRRIAGPFLTAGVPNPFFTYLDNGSNTLSAPTSGMAAASRKVLTFIQVTTTVDATTVSGTSSPVTVTTTIGMPNLTRAASSSARSRSCAAVSASIRQRSRRARAVSAASRGALPA